MTAGEAEAMGHDDVRITVITPESAPLSAFGEATSTTVAAELRSAGIELRTGVVTRPTDGGLVLDPGGERLDVQRVLTVPRIVGPAIPGIPHDGEGFILAGEDARVEGARRVWAAGDGVASAVKFGALATHQARRAASAIARLAGNDAPDPGGPILHGRILTGRGSRRLAPAGDAQGAPLWWPAGKVDGEFLPLWLAEHGVMPTAAAGSPVELFTSPVS
jgi:sulfide:quinone oxidoreductase